MARYADGLIADGEHILLRTVRCVSGVVELVMSCEPAFDYHRQAATWEYSAAAYGEAIARAGKDPEALCFVDGAGTAACVIASGHAPVTS